MSIHVKNVNKNFGSFDVLKDVNLKVNAGELTALLGPSGSGKTTLLRIIAGLEFADNGEVLLDGEDANDTHVKDRRVGFVFQHYALFKNMTVFDNVAFGLKVRPKSVRPSKEALDQKVTDLLKLVHLDKFKNRYPSQLSGGQRQRVALARALAVEPKFLLLDEPFGALDAKVRKELRSWLRKLHDEIDVTTIFVTHDQEEAMEVANKVVIMNNGQIEQVGSPAEIYSNPNNMFVYDFLGNYNEFKGWKDENGKIHYLSFKQQIQLSNNENYNIDPENNLYLEIGNFINKMCFGLFTKKSEDQNNVCDITDKLPGENDKLVNILVRPYEIEVAKNKDESYQYITCNVSHIHPCGFSVSLELESNEKQLIRAEISKDDCEKMKIARGDIVFIRPKNFRIFD